MFSEVSSQCSLPVGDRSHYTDLQWLMPANHQASFRSLGSETPRIQFIIRHKPGKAHANADTLSRLPTNYTLVTQPSDIDVPVLAVGQDTVALPTLDEIWQ